ncbi:hypothetical protein BST23_02745 [Mycolicibacterium elephantis]|uniref:Sulfotransferase family protein n=1 Tax=Mycolicibacterium elephantis TaxID=81858 RepID=A0A1X0DAH3_9MYCO|nr:hypothetical protein BST23_02745 [Mycolicibacterium elephantis]
MAFDTGSLNNPIFIVGTSRSGTSLVKHILTAHGDIFIAGETHYFDQLRPRLTGKGVGPLVGDEEQRCQDYFLALSHRPYSRGGDPSHARIDREELADFARRICAGGDGYFEAFCRLSRKLEFGASPEPSRWGEKTPRHVFRLREILTRYANAQVIYLLRDPRAVVASYRDWNEKRLDSIPTSDNAVALIAEARRVQASYHPAIIALMWKAAVNASERARQEFGDQRVRILRYEDLTLDPRRTLTELTAWLGVGFSESMMDVPNNSSYRHYDRHSRISPESVDRWRAKLSDEEIAIVDFCTGSALIRSGYSPAAPTMSVSAAAKLGAGLVRSSARAAWANRARMGENPLLYIARRALPLVKRPA